MTFERILNRAAEPIETLRLRLRDARGRGPYAGFPNAERCIFHPRSQDRRNRRPAAAL